jgi:glutathione S-transferase
MAHRVQPCVAWQRLKSSSGSMSVTLYHWEPNANSGKPMLTLAEKGVAYESRYLDLLQFDQHKPAYLAVNPDGTIPAMVHGSRVLTESTPMMEYIDDAFEGPPLKPRRRGGALAHALVDAFLRRLFRAILQHDRLEHFHRSGGAPPPARRAARSHRSDSARIAAHRVAQGLVQ